MTGTKVVTMQHYSEALLQHQDEAYHIAFKAWQMPILHGLIALAADHPDVKKLGWAGDCFIAQVRWWCREKYSEWGFTRAEVEYLDKMIDEAREKSFELAVTH